MRKLEKKSAWTAPHASLPKLCGFLALLGACSGAPFTAEPGTPLNEAGAPPAQGGGPNAGIGGLGSAGLNSASSGGVVSTAGQGGSGGTGVAGLAGVSGKGNAGGSGSSGSSSVRACLQGFESSTCATACTDNAQTGCVNVLLCFRNADSANLDNCPGYSQTAYSQALEAERNCCK